MSLFCLSRWQAWGHIIFFAPAFPDSKGCSCLLAQRRSKALQILQCLRLCPSPAARWSSFQKWKAVRKKRLLESITFISLLPFSPGQGSLVIIFWGSLFCSLMVNFSNAFGQYFFPVLLCLALLSIDLCPCIRQCTSLQWCRSFPDLHSDLECVRVGVLLCVLPSLVGKTY